MYIYLLNFSQNCEFYNDIKKNFEYLLDNSDYIITDDFDKCNICFIFLEFTNYMNGTIINNYLKYDGDIQDLKKNYILFNHLKIFLDNNKNKKFFTYYRSDESIFHSLYLNKNNYFTCSNHLLIFKDYMNDYYDNIDFLYHTKTLLDNNKNLLEYFDLNNSKVEKCYKNKINKEIFCCFPLYIQLYGPFFFYNQLKFRYPKYLQNIIKKYDIFYCKHQRNTIDGIGRKHILLNVIPKLKEKYIVCNKENIKPGEYYKYLSKSKIVISPFGLGERVEDDEISLFYNTIVIKPYPEYKIYDYFNTFTDEPFNKFNNHKFPCIIKYCKYDYSDIELIIEDIFKNYDIYLHEIELRKKLLNECLENDIIKKHFIKILDSFNL